MHYNIKTTVHNSGTEDAFDSECISHPDMPDTPVERLSDNRLVQQPLVSSLGELTTGHETTMRITSSQQGD